MQRDVESVPLQINMYSHLLKITMTHHFLLIKNERSSYISYSLLLPFYKKKTL
jgi:hypothetical protein